MSTYPKAHEGDLAGCNVTSSFGDCYTRDVIGVSMQELLFAVCETLKYNCRAQGINKMFPIGVHSKTGEDVSYKSQGSG